MQPSNEAELCNAVATAIAIDDQPSCFRFPRGNGIGADFGQNGVAKNHKGTPWEVSTRPTLAGLQRQAGSNGRPSATPHTIARFMSQGRRYDMYCCMGEGCS